MNIFKIKSINNGCNNYLYYNTSSFILSLIISKNFVRSFTIKPILSYDNSLLSKFNVLKENKDKSGIYKWTPKESGKSYIGSSICLSNRLGHYYSVSYLKGRLSRAKSAIYSALLKQGYENFSLDIIEYCEPDLLIKREQFYIDNLKPEYNILKTAGSTLGFRFKHSEATKIKLSVSKIGLKHDVSFSVNLSKARRGKNNKYIKRVNTIPKVISNNTRLLMSLKARGVSVKIFDHSNNLIKQFPTITSAALHFGVHPKTISNIFKTGRSFDDYVYKFEVKDIRIRVYNSNKELINILDSLKKASLFYNVPSTTMYRYNQSGKLYKNKFFFMSGKDS